MGSQTGKKPPCGNTFAGRLPGRLHRKPGLSNRMPDPRKTIQSAARNFLGVRRACRNTRRCARKNTCRRALSERCTTQRRKNARRDARTARDTPAETSARNTARRICSGIVHPAPKHSAGLQSRITHKTSPSYIKKKRTARCGPIARF